MESFRDLLSLDSRVNIIYIDLSDLANERLLEYHALNDYVLANTREGVDNVLMVDEVQECKEIVTAVKFLVEEGSYRYILSGSLLGVDLKDIRSVPVGYMDIVEMYPLDFEEFVRAYGVSDRVMDNLKECFDNQTPVDAVAHEKLVSLDIMNREAVPFEPYDLGTKLVPNPASTFFIRATGESMRDAGVFPNDVLIVDRSVEPVNGDVVVAAVNGDFTVKRLFKTGARIELRPENRKFRPICVTEDMDFSVWGVVKKVIHNV